MGGAEAHPASLWSRAPQPHIVRHGKGEGCLADAAGADETDVPLAPVQQRRDGARHEHLSADEGFGRRG